jgi:conjugal transfer mating pair stabilization protein TraN
MEFSCKRKVQTPHESENVREGLKEKEGINGLICKGVPCMDGNCFDKSYEMDEDMAQSVSYLGAMSQGKNDNGAFEIFEGQNRQCHKKPVGYMNCCAVGKSWGTILGAKCSKDENILRQQREKNLCVYVGKTSKKTVGLTTLIKHHFCCFNNLLEKTIQIQNKKQLGLNFGSGGNPNCRGLTFEEIRKIDWNKIDFSEFADEIKKKLVMPDIGDVQGRVESHFKDNTREFDYAKPAHEDNKRSGINKTIKECE